jgi:hypothetical protein
MGEIIRFPDEVNPRGRYVDANTEPFADNTARLR